MIQTQSGVNRINDNTGSQSHHSNAIIHTTGRVESSLLFKYPCNKPFRKQRQPPVRRKKLMEQRNCSRKERINKQPKKIGTQRKISAR